jgi:hypothetical protein
VRLWRREPVEPAAGQTQGQQRRGQRSGAPVARWNRFGDWFGAGMEAGKWEQTLIYSGVRFAGDDRLLATSFDGTVQLFQARAPLDPPQVARFGGLSPGGWSV